MISASKRWNTSEKFNTKLKTTSQKKAAFKVYKDKFLEGSSFFATFFNFLKEGERNGYKPNFKGDYKSSIEQKKMGYSLLSEALTRHESLINYVADLRQHSRGYLWFCKQQEMQQTVKFVCCFIRLMSVKDMFK